MPPSDTSLHSRNRPVVTTAYARMLLDHLRGRGIKPAAIFPEASILLLEGSDAPPQLSLDQWLGMINAATLATGDAELALKVGIDIQPRHIGMLGYVVMSCTTIGDAIEQLQRYSRLNGDISSTRMVPRGRSVDLVWQWEHAKPVPDSMPKLQMASRTTLARWLTDRREVGMTAHFQFPRPRDAEAYDRFFGSRTLFGQRENKLVLSAEFLRTPIVTANRELSRIATQQAEIALAQLTGEPAFLRELKTVLIHGLATGRASLDGAATALDISERTLQRRLDEHRTSFREVLDAVRETHACRLLENPQTSLAQVAFMLGYSEQSTFHNAFRRWTGTTPRAFRRRFA